MSTSRATPDKLQLGIYRESQRNLRKFAKELPGQKLADLAREVLISVAEHEAATGTNIANPPRQNIHDLCDALIARDDQSCIEYVLDLQAKGASPEVIHLHYLAEAARMLGQWWEDDKATFVTVTLGTSRIFSIMHAMSGLFPIQSLPTRKSAVFASVPDEGHTVGIRMATDFFRRNGWDIDLRIGLTQDELLKSIDWTQTPVFGLSYGGCHSLDALTQLMVAIKLRAPTTLVFVGGQDVSEIEEITSKLGLAATFDDVEKALVEVNAVWDTLSKDRPV